MNEKSTLFSTSRKKRRSIVNVAQMIAMLSIALFAFSLIVFALVSQFNEQKQRAQQMRASYVSLQKDITRREVERVVDSINERRGNSRQIAVANTKERVYQAYAIAENIYKTFKDTKSQSEVLETILSALRPVRFDQGNGYYFVDTLDGRVLLVADRPEIEGKHYSTFASEKEQTVIASLIDVAKRKGEGIFEYKWTMPGKQGADHHKISYLKLFKPYNLIIGTGIYLEDVEALTKRQLMEEITNIQYGNNGYFFINDFEGNVLAHGYQPNMVGASNWDYTDSRGNKLFQDLRKVVQNPKGGFSYYWWRMPETGKERPKIAFAKAVPEWEWLIGTGVYLDEVEADIQIMQVQLRNESIREISLILFVTTAIIILVYVIMGILFRPLRRDIGFFNECFALAAQQDISIDEEKIKFIELRKIAENANVMLRQKEQYLQKLHDDKQQLFVTLQSITDAVIATNRNHEIVLLNTLAEQMINCSRKKAIGKALAEVLSFFDEKTKTSVCFHIQEPLEDERSITFPEHIHLISKSGQKYNVEVVASPITNQEGTKQGGIIVLRDITEKLKVQEERLRLRKLESVGILAGGIAHDFNNLLAAILGNIDLALSDDSLKGFTKNLLSEAEKASLRAKDLTQQLLTFSKGGEPVKEASSLEDVIKESASFVLSGNKVACKYNFPSDLWLVDIDKGQISQVIQNIVLNASDAMPDGGMIAINCKNTSSVDEHTLHKKGKGKFVKIGIQDTGFGIPKKLIEKIFDPYYTTKSKGSGLGLAITQSIINKHNGEIFVESSSGDGSTFTIYLPASEKDKPHKQTVSKEIRKSSQAKILIVDDEEMIRAVTKAMLVQIGHTITLAEGGDEAIELYSRAVRSGNPFDLVIMDLTIPGGMGGKEAVKKILDINPKAKVIVSSGYSNDPVMANLKDYGFCAAIVKPFQQKELSRVVSETLR